MNTTERNNQQNTNISVTNNEEGFKNAYTFENQQENWSSQIRIGFIRKVYGILSVQLLITVGITLLSFLNDSFANFQRNNIALLYVSIFSSLIISLVIICVRKVARSVPLNYILLGVFTLCESYFVSFLCSNTDPQIVLMAAVMTLGVVGALTLYAVTTKTDFTLMGGLFFIFSIVMILFGIFMFFSQNKVLHIIYSSLSVILFGLYLIYDTQLIIGNHSLKLSIDDYILGAIMLYTDIINMFIHILRLLDKSR